MIKDIIENIFCGGNYKKMNNFLIENKLFSGV